MANMHCDKHDVSPCFFEWKWYSIFYDEKNITIRYFNSNSY